ncbi:amidohydrolase family protein [Hyphomonas johnsonii]|uniref:Amidohydrolase family protein n=1 Tax=Hyphomonas johnsonii MHS-2 TaxID=1280950 RepID=A0A059FMC7_9PROT|nr:amidohydrolase family protein [Hyphomonas johnsonii]KCZ91830.1 amidohydrolase family protein [Hyphomonas johnsonii MHS-2]
MTYAGGRLVHDADSHLMEPVDCLDPYFDARLLARFRALPYMERLRAEWAASIDASLARHEDAAFRAEIDDNILLRKNYEAHGAWAREDRPHALDLLGFASQLVFTTRCLGNFGLDQGDDMELCYAAADAHNRMMTDICSADRRLLATAYVPLEDIERAIQTARAAIGMGAKALMVPSLCPQHHSPSHVGLDPVWAMAEEAGLPILFHVGGEEKLNPAYKENGLPPVPDFHGGDDNFTSVSYMPIPNSAMQTLATLIFDGVFDRFPALKFGAIELGASWVPGWMRSMDSAAHAFMRNETRLQTLSARPSEIVRRQFRAAPYPHEDAGWIIANAGEEVCLFSSDYPHVEGGRNPLKRFDESLKGQPPRAIEAFYSGNFIDLMGEGLAKDLRRPVGQTAA